MVSHNNSVNHFNLLLKKVLELVANVVVFEELIEDILGFPQTAIKVVAECLDATDLQSGARTITGLEVRNSKVENPLHNHIGNADTARNSCHINRKSLRGLTVRARKSVIVLNIMLLVATHEAGNGVEADVLLSLDDHFLQSSKRILAQLKANHTSSALLPSLTKEIANSLISV
jgi:hypothetical protein